MIIRVHAVRGLSHINPDMAVINLERDLNAWLRAYPSDWIKRIEIETIQTAQETQFIAFVFVDETRMHEQPKMIEMGDERIGKTYQHEDFVGTLRDILRFEDGTEYFHLQRGPAGKGNIPASECIEVQDERLL